MPDPTTTQPAVRRSGLARLVQQVGWSFVARVVSAVLQLAVIVMLARGLPPREFAWVASVNVVMVLVVATNGFGLLRQIQLRRARDRDDATLPGLFNLWQICTTTSAVLWVVVCVVLWLVTGEVDFLAVVPVALWLVFEQTTTLWNALSLVDGRSQDLMPSYLYRRVPVVALLALALALDWHLVSTWAAGLALGSALAYLRGYAGQEAWARRLLPRRREPGDAGGFDLAYWWSSVGVEVRDLDVAVITAMSAATGGVYALPARLVKPMNLVTVATASVAFPRLARRDVVTRRQLLLYATAGTMPVVVVAGVLAAVAGLLPDLVGPEYAAAVPALRVLCIAAVITGFGGLVMVFMQTRAQSANRFSGYAVLTAGIVQIVLAGVVVAAGGDATDAAWAASGTQGAFCALLTLRAFAECGKPRQAISEAPSTGV
jgi:lipopolysaccharide exporter